MDQNEERIGRLLEGYLKNELSPAERTELFTALSQDENLLTRHTEKLPLSFTGSVPVNAESRQQILAAILKVGKIGEYAPRQEEHPASSPREVKAPELPSFRPAVHRIHFRKWRWAAAAVVALLISGAYFWWRPAVHREIAATSVIDVKPGGNKARLTLADGSSVLLDSTGNQVIEQGTTAIHVQNGQLKYDVRSSTATIVYNTLTTPRGGQFRVTLPDGTAVWLNAASSLRYPTAFIGKERRVEVTGEAYFEVAKNARMPLKVKIDDQTEIQVLGTHFNVNAYTDEASINTTLLDGAVNVNAYRHSQLLAPGQQVQLSRNAAGGGQLSLVASPDLDQVMAWKNGSFLFNNTNLDVVMRQLARWYDVDVVYQKGIPPIKFAGEMKRDLNLSEVLNILRKMEVRCNLEGKKLIVMP